MTEPSSSDEDDEELDPEAAERGIAEFIESAALLAGPPVHELAEQVAQVFHRAWDEVDRLMAEVAYNKLLATMLLVGQQARQLAPDQPEQWRLHAAGSILSGLVGIRAADRAHD